MKITALAFVASLVASSTQALYDLQSAPFRLIVQSATNYTLSGLVLEACHEGAAIEGLCLTNQTIDDPAAAYDTFYFNVSSSAGDSPNTTDTEGILSYILTISGGVQVPSAMRFSYNPGSNLADPIFSPGQAQVQPVAFDECEQMYVSVSLDDMVSPPTSYEEPLKLQNWFVCLTRFSYLYTTVTFKLGVVGEPQNPSCEPVSVVRVWI